MRVTKGPFSFLLVLLFLFVNSDKVFGQGACHNFSFELGNLDGWKAGTGCKPEGLAAQAGDCRPGGPKFKQCCPFPHTQVANDASVTNWDATHVICNRGTLDSITKLPAVPENIPGFPESDYSLRIGNARIYSEAEIIERTIDVEFENALIAFQYAFVMNDPATNVAAHGGLKGLPYFEVRVFRGDTSQVIPCGIKRFNSQQGVNKKDVPDPNFPDYTNQQTMKLSYTDWEMAFVDLSDMVGQTVTLRVTNTDCSLGGHFGYTYFVPYCRPFIPLKDTTICANEPVTLKSPYPMSGWDLLWSTGETTEEITVNPSETTTYTLKVKNRLNPDEVTCQNETEVTITVLTGNPPVLEDTIVCKGDKATLVATPAGTLYDWYTEPAGGTPFHNGETYTTPIITEKVTYYVQNPAKCATDERTPVTVDIIDVTADATPESVICNGGGQILNVEGGKDGAKYVWEPANSLDKPDDKNPIASPTVTTTYTVTVTDSEGRCPVTDTVTIRVEEIVADLDGTDVCIGLVTEFKNLTVPGNVGGDWKWEFGDGEKSSEMEPTHIYQDPGRYIVKLNVVSGTCESEDTTVVEVYPNPVAAFTPTPRKTTADDPTITFLDECELAVRGEWNFGDGQVQPYVPGQDPVHLYYATNEGEGPFKYTIKLSVVSEYGCPAEVVDEIEIENVWTIYVPNSFTPNGDGINDYFKAYGMGILDFKMTVFNRWGEVVYRGNNINEGWDGTPISGSNIKQDVYVWKIKAQNNRGKVIRLVGHVSLLPTGDE